MDSHSFEFLVFKTLPCINLYDLIFHERLQALKELLNKNLLNCEKEKSKQMKEWGRKKWESG